MSDFQSSILHPPFSPADFIRQWFHRRTRDVLLFQTAELFNLSEAAARTAYDDVAREFVETPRPVHALAAKNLGCERRAP